MSHSNRIKTLPKHVANQIAAGEVIERPASVLKELIENSIDAGASHIEVDIDNGGMGLIRVRDNGCGIVKEDLALAVLRHATSKIQQTKDLFSIGTLGFRGEALASMSSIAKMKISSHAKGAQQAWTLNIGYSVPEQESTDELSSCSHPIGTSIELRDLFFNVPARRKFLKSAKTEWHHLYDVFKKFVLSHPDIGFVIKHNGKRHKSFVKVDTLKNMTGRIKSICNAEFLENSHYIEVPYDNMTLKGWVGLLPAARRYADQQYFFLNHRAVKDKLISHAIKQAFQQNLSGLEGQYPSYILFLDVAADCVDVNVHPTKHEVRFQQATTVHDFIEKCIKDVLLAHRSPNETVRVFDGGEEISKETGEIFWPEERSVARSSIGLSTQSAPTAFPKQRNSPQYSHKPMPELLYQKEEAPIESLQRYFLVELSNDLVIVDLARAATRLLEQYVNQAESHDLQVPLLIPHVFKYIPSIFTSEVACLEKMGFAFQLYTDSVVVTHIPFFMTPRNISVLETAEKSADIYVLANLSSLEKIPKTVLTQMIKLWVSTGKLGPWLRVHKEQVSSLQSYSK